MQPETDEQRAREHRRAHRQSIREEIASRTVLLERRAAMQSEIQRLDAKAAEAADEHTAACKPLQEELASLERLAISRIADRQPADPTQDSRRAELAAEIERRNSELRETCDRLERLKQPVHQNIADITKQISGLRTEMALFRAGAAEPELLWRKFAVEHLTDMLNRLHSGLKSSLEAAKANDLSDPLDHGGSRERRWLSVFSLLGKCNQLINDESRQVMQEMRED